MILTRKQLEGLHICIDKFKKKEKYAVISGFAGSGKSTLIKFIIEALSSYNIDPDEDVCFATFTGKASEVLRKKGNKNSTTLHKLLYETIPRADGTFIHRKKANLQYKIVVADECSMIPKEMVDQLFSYHNLFVIYLGDPFQIPPINSETNNHLLDNPDIFLDEIMRQAKESEIIKISMDIREGRLLNYTKGKEVQILNKNKLTTSMLSWADQILVATNATRNSINNTVRACAGKCASPQDGDKIICCRNYWDICDNDNNPLINGTIGYLNKSYSSQTVIPAYISSSRKQRSIPIISGDFLISDDIYYNGLNLDYNLMTINKKSLNPKEEYKMHRNKKLDGLVPLEFEYGYAITTHKAQGSQWDKVLVIEEQFPFDREEHARWLYTACTRASEKLVLVR